MSVSNLTAENGLNEAAAEIQKVKGKGDKTRREVDTLKNELKGLKSQHSRNKELLS